MKADPQDGVSYLFVNPDDMPIPDSHVDAISILQEYSGRLWREGQQTRSLAIGSVIRALAEEHPHGPLMYAIETGKRMGKAEIIEDLRKRGVTVHG